MNFYNIGYYDWEESPYTILAHNDKFSKSDFDEIVLKCYVIANDKLKLAHSEWFNEWLDDVISKDKNLDNDYINDMRYKPCVSELHNEVINTLKSDFNFFDINVQCSFSPTNSFDVLNDDSDDEDLMKIKHRLTVVEKRDKKIKKILN